MKPLLLLAGCCLGASAQAQTFELPPVQAGESWKYHTTTERGTSGWSQTDNEITVNRVTGSSLYIAARQSGSTQPPSERVVGRDWSRRRDVNGTETTVNRPLAFPLAPGKSWEVDYTEAHPNKAHREEKWHFAYTAVGMETVEVPAGKFTALKIEAEGTWNAETEPSQTVVQGAQVTGGGTTLLSQSQNAVSRSASGRTYKAFWYVPQTHRWVKSVEEYYNNEGVRNERYSEELVAYKPAG